MQSNGAFRGEERKKSIVVWGKGGQKEDQKEGVSVCLDDRQAAPTAACRAGQCGRRRLQDCGSGHQHHEGQLVLS